MIRTRVTARRNPDGSTTCMVFALGRCVACQTSWEPWLAAARATGATTDLKYLFATGQRRRKKDRPLTTWRKRCRPETAGDPSAAAAPAADGATPGNTAGAAPSRAAANGAPQEKSARALDISA